MLRNNFANITEKFIAPQDRNSIGKITKFERTAIEGFRAEQLANCAVSYLTEIPENIINDPLKIAILEFEKGLIPFKILRPKREFGQIVYEQFIISPVSELYIPKL